MGASSRSEEEVGTRLRRLELHQTTLQVLCKRQQGHPHNAGDELHNVEIQGWAVRLSWYPANGLDMYFGREGGADNPRFGPTGKAGALEQLRASMYMLLLMQGGDPSGGENLSGIQAGRNDVSGYEPQRDWWLKKGMYSPCFVWYVLLNKGRKQRQRKGKQL